MVRVLHVVEELSPAGTETWLMNVLRHIDRNRFQLDFLVHAEHACAYDAEAKDLGARILRCARPRSLSYLNRLGRTIDAHGPYQAVHSHVHLFSGIVLSAAVSRAPIRIAHSHTTAGARRDRGILRSFYSRVMKQAISSYATHCLGASEDALNAFFGSNWRADPRCSVVPCGIPFDEFARPANAGGIRTGLGLPRGGWIIGHVGRFEEPKNHEFLLEIARYSDPLSHFLLVGDGSGRAGFEAKARDAGLLSRFTITGNRRNVPELLLGAMDAFVFPSRYEGLGLALVEAQAAGLHCLFTDSLPKEATVIPALCHRAPLSAGPKAWASRLSGLRAAPRVDPKEAREAAENGQFNIRRSVGRLEEIYATAA